MALRTRVRCSKRFAVTDGAEIGDLERPAGIEGRVTEKSLGRVACAPARRAMQQP